MKPCEPSIHRILLDLLNLEVSMDDGPECQMRQNSLDWDFTIVLSNFLSQDFIPTTISILLKASKNNFDFFFIH